MTRVISSRDRGAVPTRVWVYRQICQEVCPWNVRFAEVALERVM